MNNIPALAPIFVIEGIDGSGKGTQSRLLAEQLNARGIDSQVLSFPQYENTFFGARIGDFLNGKFGELGELNPFLVSLLYAGDRFESKTAIQQARETSEIIILDRYVPSNIAHQAAKLDGEARKQLGLWIEKIEYEIFGLPRPHRIILLDTPVDVSQKLIADKSARTYTDQAADLQEADTTYMARVRNAYLDLSRDNPQWITIPVAEAERIRSIDEISEDIFACVLKDLKTVRGSSR